MKDLWNSDRFRDGTLSSQKDVWRPATQHSRAASEPVRFPPELTRALENFGRQEGVTTFMILLAALAGLLHRYTGEDDLVVGAPSDQAGMEQASGVVATPVLLRIDLSGDPAFRTLLRRVREVALNAYPNRGLPIVAQREMLQPHSRAGYASLFEVMFALRDVARATVAGGPTITPSGIDCGTAQADLTLWLHASEERGDQSDQLSGVLHYDGDVFAGATAAQMVRHFQVVIEGAIADPTCPLSQLRLMTDAERRQVCAWSTKSAVNYPSDRCIHQLFEAQADRTPDATALVHEGRALSFAAVNERANQLARVLRSRGVGPDLPVGVCLERSMELVPSLLGVLKAGGAYLALDPTAHPEQLAYMVRDSGMSLVVGRRAQVRTFVDDDEVLCVDPEWHEIAHQSPENLVCETTPSNLAYTIYTSGTTGRPKGVDVPHRGVVRLVWGLDCLPVQPTDVFLQLTSMSFDLATLEIWYPLLHGARLAIYPPRFESFRDLGRVLDQERVTCLWLTASLFNAIIDDAPQALSGVRDLLIGGEALSVPHVKRALQLLPSTRIINGYGPTEATTFTHCYPIPRTLEPALRSIPIGRPIGGTEGWILDPRLNPVPVGVPGELYVGGEGLARGYRNQPELTAAKFIPHPFDETPGARLYATGDRARYLADGVVEFLGRFDSQVKIRGFRVELEGIEATMIGHPAVRQAVVTYEQDAMDTRLVAYVVLDPVATCPVSELRAFLESSLPDYMVPSRFIVLNALPLTASGKVDRRALARSARPPEGRSTASAGIDVRATTPGIPRRENRTTSALSFAQQRLWFLHQLDPESSSHNRPTLLRLTGRLDPDCLFDSLQTIARRHEILRTVFPSVDGEPYARVLDAAALTRTIDDLTTLAEPARLAASHEVITETIGKPFELAAGPLARVRLLRLGSEDHLLLLVTHHIIFDGWSASVFIEELRATYRARSAGELSALPDLAIQYGDFAEWQRDQAQGPKLADDLAYWRACLADAPPVSPLSREPLRQSREAHETRSQVVRVDADLAQEVKTLGRENGATLFMTLLAAFAVLLARGTEHSDIVCGTPAAGRRRRETESLLGLFVNVLPLRLVLSHDRSFREVLRDTRSVVLGALAHQDVPFERLVQELQPAREIGRPPLVQVLFQLRNYPRPRPATSELEINQVDWPGPASEFDLAVDATESENALECRFRYASGVLPDGTAGLFRQLLEEIVIDPDRPVGDLLPLSPAERRQLSEWSEAATSGSDDRCIHELFESRWKRSPSSSAFLFADETLTYKDLHDRSDRLARELRSLGVGPEIPVAIFLKRSFDSMVALLGTLKAGGAYLALDPGFPETLLSFMIHDARVPVIVTSAELRHALPPCDAVTVLVPSTTADSQEFCDGPPIVTAGNAAYMMYTSGSTGQPKGVIGLHRGAINWFAWMWRTYPFAPDEVCCQQASLGVVESVWEIFGPLLQGVPSVIIPDDVVQDPAGLVTMLGTHRVTRLVAMPSLLGALLDGHDHLGDALPALRLVISCGESLSVDVARRFKQALPRAQLLNLYGSSEASTAVTCYDVSLLDEDDRTVPIGRPISNSCAYVLNGMTPAPPGVRGELYVGGPGLGREYIGRPDLTAERFVRNPFTPERFPTLFRTGDLACYRRDGNLEFLGRSRQQIQIRGCRAQPCDVEAALHQHAGVREAAVTGEATCLRAYIVPVPGAVPSTAELRRFLKQRLAGFLVPSEFVFVDSLPRTPHGTVNLLALSSHVQPSKTPETAGAVPQGEVEVILTQFWEQLLGVRPIQPDQDFFELGGHSLLAARLFARVERHFGQRLPLSTLFEASTIRQQARLLRRHEGALLGCSLVVVQSNGSKPPLFCMAAVGGNVLTYRDLSKHLGPDQPCYGLQSYGLTGPTPAFRGVEEAAAQHIDEILGVQPEGPYFLCGTSFGGLIGLEIAQQLTARGHEVAVVAMFDTYGPGYPKLLPTTSRARWKFYRFLRRLELHARNVLTADFKRNVRYIRNKGIVLGHRLADRMRRKLQSLRDPLPQHLHDVEAANVAARYGYQPKPYPGRIVLFRASRQPIGIHKDPTLGWAGMAAKGLEIYEVPGSHGAIIHEPLVGALAAQLKVFLAARS